MSVRVAGGDDIGATNGDAQSTLSQLQLQELLTEVQGRITRMSNSRSQVDGLLEAILVVAAGLDVEHTLTSIVRSAMTLADARYGALGVDGEARPLEAFIHQGIAPEVVEAIGELPTGSGLLGMFQSNPTPMRIDDIAAHPSSVGFPPGHPPMTTFLGSPITVRGTIFGTIYLTEKNDGGPFTEDDEVVIHALAAAAGIAIENARLFEQSQSQLAWIEATRDIATELLSGANTTAALEMVARKARVLTGADLAFIALPGAAIGPDGGATELVITVADGDGGDGIHGQVIPINGSTTGAAYRTRTATRKRSLEFDATAGTATRFGPALVASMCVGESVRGVIVGLRTDGAEPFGKDTVGLLSSFADQAALAMSMAESAARLRELDILSERDRIGRDLHDHVIQRIFAAGLSLQSTAQRTQTPDIKRRLTATTDDLQDIIQDIRAAIFDLHGSSVLRGRLREGLHTVIDELCDGQSMHFGVRMSGPLSVVEPALAEHVIAVVREAVSNAIRHSRGSRGIVSVTVAHDLTVSVSDDGCGIPDDISSRGLTNLESRARECGGRLEVISPRPDGGTEIIWAVPLP